LWVISLIAFIGIFIIENIRKPILIGYVADKVNSKILTSVISAQSQLKTILTIVIVLVFGIISDYYGIGKALIIISGFLVFTTVLVNEIHQKKVI